MERNKIKENIKTVVCNILTLDDTDDIKDGVLLSKDLGAESIDYVDIIYSVSKKFGMDFERSHVFPDRMLLSDNKFINDGKINEKGKQLIKEKWPHIPKGKLLLLDTGFKDFYNYLETVDIFTDYIEHRLKNKE